MDVSKQQFQQLCYEKLLTLFTQSKLGTSSPQIKGRVEGFIHAGETLGLLDKATSNQLMEKAHLQIFGESISDRQAHKQAIAKLDEDWLNIPAYERLNNSFKS